MTRTIATSVNPHTECLLPIQDFADRLGISVWTARAMAYRGEISSVKLGRRLQVPASEVQRLIKENLRPRLVPA